MFHHHPWLNATQHVTASLNVCGLLSNGHMAGSVWTLGDACGNWWPQWWQDRATYNLTQYNAGWSAYDGALSFYNATQAATFYTQLAPEYAKLANLTACETSFYSSTDGAGCLQVNLDMAPHSIVFLALGYSNAAGSGA